MAIIFLHIYADKTSNHASYHVCPIFYFIRSKNTFKQDNGKFVLVGGFTISLTTLLFLKVFFDIWNTGLQFSKIAYWQDILGLFLLKCDIANFHVELEIVVTWDYICYVWTCIGHLFCKNRDILQNNKY